jgi:coenzyme PQQ precursor peptide PqqA
MPPPESRRWCRSSAEPQGDAVMTKKVWQAPKVETTPVSMEVTMYLPAQA